MSEHACDAADGSNGLSPRQRAAYRSFVRTHHPDRGGDPEVFVAGLAYYRDLAAGAPRAPGREPDRYDAPVEIVPDLPLPTRVLVALIRTLHRRRRPRVE
ncbi:hypothetical protein [Pseudonocardia sp. KRD291]|uniref:hypothetical protein n=1 Tax=Pseudonocardia sp. KRD291 TaxID=2792007 RepID=UPI001C4A69F2|nr:hypothetical protein [Pseudonocardia sp. KRD291]MBW0105959.1 hypothetical protein [Pseudonocardia sp. KRD291]